jgi:pantetheine-phosphate adenylyltransferase
VIEFAREHGARSIVKGLRAVSDFEWEFQMNNLNRGLAPEIETLYMMSSPKYSFLSSRGVREIASFGGPVAEYVPEQVARRLAEMHAAGAI